MMDVQNGLKVNGKLRVQQEKRFSNYAAPHDSFNLTRNEQDFFSSGSMARRLIQALGCSMLHPSNI
jgi:hypothetical protein